MCLPNAREAHNQRLVGVCTQVCNRTPHPVIALRAIGANPVFAPTRFFRGAHASLEFHIYPWN